MPLSVAAAARVSPGHMKRARLLHASMSSRDRSNYSPLSRGKRLGQATTQPSKGRLDPCGPTSAAPNHRGRRWCLGWSKSMPARPGRLEVYECSLNHLQSMQSPPTYELSYGFGVPIRHG